MLVNYREPPEALAALPERFHVIKDGVVVVENCVQTLFTHHR